MGVRARFAAVLILSPYCFGQLPSRACDVVQSTLQDCTFSTPLNLGDDRTLGAASSSNPNQSEMFIAMPAGKKRGFHWGRALFESFMFFSIEQAYVVHDDYRWVVIENGIPFNHYWRDYKQSLSAWVNAGWDDGDPWLYSYVGHPIQGAMTGYIQIQNDPAGERLEFEDTKAYWNSRLKALFWNAAYSTQWNIGPLSELTFEKYGTRARPPWNKDGSWPCNTQHCFTGVGQVDLVTTPVGGLAWILAEDLLDRHVARRIEESTRNHFVIDFVRCAVNPIRGGANILHGKPPWHRASRDAREVYRSYQQKHLEK